MVFANGRCGKLMGCNCGGSKRIHAQDPLDVLGGYKYLKRHQIDARLEIYKKRYCKDCELRYKCNYSRYMNCSKKPKLKAS